MKKQQNEKAFNVISVRVPYRHAENFSFHKKSSLLTDIFEVDRNDISPFFFACHAALYYVLSLYVQVSLNRVGICSFLPLFVL